jgi:4-hydroxybenzoate polyprenyltransferase
MTQNIGVSLLTLFKSRVMVIFTFTFPALVNLLIASHLTININQIVLLTLCVTLTSYSIYWFNDYCDVDVDRINKINDETDRSNRPLISGKITKKLLISFIIIIGSVGLLIAYIINIYVLVTQLAFLFLGYIYSADPIRLKKRFIGKQFTIVIGAILSCLSGAYTFGTILPANMYSILINAIIYATAPTLGDIRDILPDKKIGIKTLPVVFGANFTVRFSIAGFIAVILAGLIGYYGIGFNIALPILTAISMGAWIFTVYPLLQHWEDAVYVEKIVYKRIIPSNLLIQIIPLIGLLVL